jgi:hypothetical protein
MSGGNLRETESLYKPKVLEMYSLVPKEATDAESDRFDGPLLMGRQRTWQQTSTDQMAHARCQGWVKVADDALRAACNPTKIMTNHDI